MASTSDVLVVGGGFAGLACATALAEKGAKVLVLEKKTHCGGRAYSFADPDSGDPVDNGQHLFLSCYTETRRFLERIGTAPRLKFERGLRVPFVEPGGRKDVLSSPSFLKGSAAFGWGVLGLKGLTLGDKWGLARLKRSLGDTSLNSNHDSQSQKLSEVFPELNHLTVTQWLDRIGQSRRIQERLWDPLALGILNEKPDIAAATGLAQALRRILGETDGARLGLARVGLSDLYAEEAGRLIEKKGGRVLPLGRAAEIIEEKGRVRGVVLASGERLESGAVVSAIAPWDLAALKIPEALKGPWMNLQAAPIIGISLWLDRPLLGRELVAGLLGTQVQWLFNKSRILSDVIPAKAGIQSLDPGFHRGDEPVEYLSAVISGAHRELNLKPEELFALTVKDISACFPQFDRSFVKRYRVVKEPRATLSPVPGSESWRPMPASGMQGFYFAGDWTRTGLPATIESAVLSGHLAAQAVLKSSEFRNGAKADKRIKIGG